MTINTTDGLVRLRNYTLDDCAILDDNPETLESDRFSYFGVPVPNRLRRLVDSGEAFPKYGDLTGRLAVEAQGEFVGGVSWHPENYGPINAPAINIGIGLIPAGRGKGYGTEAQRLLVDYLFNCTTVYRIEAGTDVENIAEQRSLEKAGMLREGIMRGCHFREGKYNDMVLYAVTRADFEAARAARSGTKVSTGFTASR
ncbi:GNAT family protein [Catenulispora yoronensis]|uniref:GNAT family protein n=1 Tax=Catenulispora yoronensis TaxID=450799 RepID=A0ABP5GJB4_9ACTN